MSKARTRRIISLCLAFVLAVSLCPISSAQATFQSDSKSASQSTSTEQSTHDSADNSSSNSNEVYGTENDSGPLSSLPKSSAVIESDEGTVYTTGEVLVTMKSSVESATTTETLQEARTVTTDEVTDENKVSHDTLVAEVADWATVAQAMAELEADPDVEAVQPNYIYTLMDDESADEDIVQTTQQSLADMVPQSAVSINDPLASNQWGIESANIDEAWSLAKSNGSVGVAVLDTGVKADHPDLQDNIVGATCTTTGDTDTTVNDTNSHGTHVCGIVSAAVDNSIGVAGISYNAKIIPVRVFKRNGACSTADIIKGFEYVLSNQSLFNIKVINLSLGGVGIYDAGDYWDQQFVNAIVKADEAGILTVCASGNAGNYNVGGETKYYSAPFDCWPGNFDEAIGKDTILTVGNISSSRVRSSSSNYGPTLDVVAPGTSILSTTTSYSSTYGGYYGIKNGTSMSAPFASACAALCFAAKPTATVDEVRSCLEDTALDLGLDGRDDEYGYGEINAYAAVISMLGIDIQGDDFVRTGTTSTYSLTSEDVSDVVWSVSNSLAATINETTGVLTPHSSGTVTVTATSGSYSWSKDVDIQGDPNNNMSDAVVSVPSLVYTGLDCKPMPTVTFLGIELTEGIDYTLSWSNNVNAGSNACVVVTAKKGGRFTGSKTQVFTIAKAPLSATYAGESITFGETPALTVTVTGFVNSETATTAAGYTAPTVTAPTPQTVGSTSLTPAGGAADNYSFTYTAGNLVVTAATVAAPTAATDLSYTGAEQTGVAAPATGAGYTLSGTTKATGAGNYTATAKLTDTTNTTWDDGTTGDKTLAWSIAKAPLSATYAGESITFGETPALTVTVTGFVNSETATTAAGYTAPTVTAPTPQTVGSTSLTPAGGAADNYSFTYTAGDLVVAEAPVVPATNERLFGEDSSETAAAISKEAYPEGSEWVVLARNDDFADAMSATGLAGTLKAPIVLTDLKTLSASAAAEITRLHATKCYIIGGTGAVSGDIEGQLASAGVSSVSRIAGTESWDTSVKCAEKIAEHGGNVGQDAVVAMSSNFQDALSISSFAYAYGVPIYLESSKETNRELPAEAQAAIKGFTGTIYVAGGSGAVPAATVEDTFTGHKVVRLAGTDGFDTSNQIATYMVENSLLSAKTTCVACGALEPKGTDALAGAALAGKNGGVMLLVNSNPKLGSERIVTIEGADSNNTPAFLTANASSVRSNYILGGFYVVSEDLKDKIGTILA